jgi:hypothetical protein
MHANDALVRESRLTGCPRIAKTPAWVPSARCQTTRATRGTR